MPVKSTLQTTDRDISITYGHLGQVASSVSLPTKGVAEPRNGTFLQFQENVQIPKLQSSDILRKPKIIHLKPGLEQILPAARLESTVSSNRNSVEARAIEPILV